MIINNEERMDTLFNLLRGVQINASDAWYALSNNNDLEFANLVTKLIYCVDCIGKEVTEASKEEYESCIKQMLEEERENGDE